MRAEKMPLLSVVAGEYNGGLDEINGVPAVRLGANSIKEENLKTELSLEGLQR